MVNITMDLTETDCNECINLTDSVVWWPEFVFG